MTNEPSKPGTPPPAAQATGVVQGTGVPAAAGAKPATTVTAGTLIMGTYEIEKLINSGGMGEVYRGRNIHNGEPVAIKIVLPSLAHDPKIVALFQKESTTLSRLSHDAIVRYHVFTVDPTIGRPCMVMEFVSGTAMSDRIEQGPMPADDVRTMLRRVASGLDKAHRAGVVHRDLSPDNVILEEGNVEHAKLIDFGIAKSTAMGAGTLLQGQFAGKFNWVAPEQLGAFGGNVDGRSDIYSLALVTAAASKGEVLAMGASIVDAVGKRASVPDLTGVDASLVPLLSWMLQPDPALRPESMAKVMAAVDNPDVIPKPATTEPKAPDPNRTIIGGALPPFDLSATDAVVQTKSEPPVTPQSMPPKAGSAPPAAAGWDMPADRVQTSPPQGATVIASVPPMPPRTEEEPEDFSPFGALGAAAKPQVAVAAPVAAVVAKKGKGGMVAVLALLAAGAGGAGAYYSGVFDPKPAVAVDEKPPVTDAAADEAKAAEDAKVAEAAKKAADDAAAKAAADALAAEKLAADKLAADKLAADKAAAEKLAADQAAETSTDQAAADKAAADKAAAEAKAAEEAAQKAAAEAAAAAAEAAKLAAAEAEKKAAEEAAAQKAAADAAAATKAAEEAAAQKAAAEAKAAEDAAKSADPVARQTAFLAAMTPAECAYVSLADPKPEGFALHGFAADTKPLEVMAAAWESETGTKPDVQVHLINPEQCALLDFINRHPTAVDVVPIAVTMDPALGEVVKSGGVVKGSVSGLGAGALTLLNVSGTGGISNLNKFISTSDDGTIGFSIVLKLAEGAPPAPQLFLAMESEEKLQALLAAVDAGVSAKALMPFIDLALKKDPAPIKLGLAFIRLEN